MSAVRLADVGEAEAFLAANPDVVQVECFLTDPSGVPRGKVLRRSEVLGAYRNGRPLPCSILSLDIRGADVEETGLVWDEGDSDRVCRPVAGSLTRAPWRRTPTAQFVLTSYEKDGTPSEADPRHALARVVEACRAAGLHPVTAVETEFYLLDGRAAAEGRIAPPAAPNGFRPADLQAYLVQDLQDFSAFLDDVYRAADLAGLPARTLIAEYSPGRLEIVLEHRDDPLRGRPGGRPRDDVVEDVPEGLPDRLVERPLDHRLREPVGPLLVPAEDEVVLGREVPEEAAPGHADRVGDVVDRRLLEAVRDEEVLRRVDELDLHRAPGPVAQGGFCL